MSQPSDDSTEQFPECAKVSAITEQFDVCRNLLYWMADEKGIDLCIESGNRSVPCMETTDSLLYQFFGIDEKRLEGERDRILEDYRKYNNAAQETAPSNPQTGAS